MADAGDMRLSLFFGLLFTCMLFGAAVGQAAWYYAVYRKDSDWLMLLVGMVLILNLAQSVLLSFAAYYSTLSWLQPSSLDMVTWSLPSSIAVTYVLTFIVQCFFLGRIWIMSQKNKLLTTAIAVLVVLQITSGMGAFATLKIDNVSSSLLNDSRVERVDLQIPILDITSKTKLGMTVQMTSSLAADLSITISLVYFINRRRATDNSIWTSNSIVNKLLLLTISTGLLTSLMTLANLILFQTMARSYYWLIPHALSSKLYVNSFFSTLNSRRSVQELFRRNSQLFPTPPPILTPRPSIAMLNGEQESRGRDLVNDHTGELLPSRSRSDGRKTKEKSQLGEVSPSVSPEALKNSVSPRVPGLYCAPVSRSGQSSRPALTSISSPDDMWVETPPKLPWSTSPAASNMRTPVSGHSVHSSRFSMHYISDSDNITGISSIVPSFMPVPDPKRMTGRSAGSGSTRSSPRSGRVSSKSAKSKKSTKSNRSVPQIGSLNFPSEIRLTLESRASSSASLLTTGSNPARFGGDEFF